LYTSLQSFVSERNLGEVFYAPVDVVFGEHDIVQPDLLFVRRENAGIVGQQAVEGTPDLIIEILSPGSLHLDRHRKRALYERVGVPEFWLVDPANRAIEVFRLGDLAEHVRVHIALGVAVLHRHAVEHVHHPGQSLPFIDTGSILM
jgi:Uma2 family endonuclease